LINVIIDTNILFSILLGKNPQYRDLIYSEEEYAFFSCKFGILELFKHKDKIIRYSSLLESEILESFYELLRKINFYNEDIISNHSMI
jgi:hypothetical protein